jgi:hypothetical protein
MNAALPVVFPARAVCGAKKIVLELGEDRSIGFIRFARSSL